MSVLIQNMQMPKTCTECMKSGLRTVIHCKAWSEISAGQREQMRSLWCPMEPVTMCKDCRYWGQDGYREGCKYATGGMTEDDYCSNAEPKENNE